jgi:hypothetical protein
MVVKNAHKILFGNPTDNNKHFAGYIYTVKVRDSILVFSILSKESGNEHMAL